MSNWTYNYLRYMCENSIGGCQEIHFLLPFVIAGVTLIHLALLHKVGVK